MLYELKQSYFLENLRELDRFEGDCIESLPVRAEHLESHFKIIIVLTHDAILLLGKVEHNTSPSIGAIVDG